MAEPCAPADGALEVPAGADVEGAAPTAAFAPACAPTLTAGCDGAGDVGFAAGWPPGDAEDDAPPDAAGALGEPPDDWVEPWDADTWAPAEADTPADTAGAAVAELVGAGAAEELGAAAWLGAGAGVDGGAELDAPTEAPALADATGELTLALTPADTPDGEAPTLAWTPALTGLDVDDGAGADVAAGAGLDWG